MLWKDESVFETGRVELKFNDTKKSRLNVSKFQPSSNHVESGVEQM